MDPVNPPPPAPPANWSSPSAPPPTRQGAVPPKQKGDKRKWIVGGVVVVLALAAVGSLGDSDDPQVGSATPAPTPVAAQATATPTEMPGATASDSPTELPGAGASEQPTLEPAADPTLAPTREPTAGPTEPPPAALLKKSGRGDKVLKFAALDEPAVARITCAKCGGNFAVISYAGTDYDSLLVNEIGKYSGRVYVGPGVSRLQISATGRWTVDLLPLALAKQWDGTTALTGKGDSVVVLSGGSFGTTNIKNKSQSNFAVIAYGESGEYLELLVNEIGAYSGEVLLPVDDPIVLSISAVGGTWSFSPVES